MAKYLYEKIEQTKGGAYFENIIFIANEVCRGRASETFENFSELEPEEIAKILGWNNKKETLQLIKSEIKDECFDVLLLKYNVTGFIAECRMPECSNFRFKEDQKEPSSWNVNGSICRIFWIYADSIGELVEKLIIESDKIFHEEIEKYKNNDLQAKTNH